MLETSFAHCSSTMLRRGRGKKHKIVQIAVFSIIFVSDCSRIWQKFTNYISCFSLLGIFSAHKTNYYTDTHKHTNTLTHVKTYMHTDILTYAYTHTQPNIHSPKHTLIHPYRLKFCLIPIFNLQLELVLIKFFTKRCHCPLRLSLHFSYGDRYYSLYFWQFTRHPPSFLWHFLIVSTKCTNSNQHNPYLMARSSLSLFKWQLLISAIFLFTFRFDDYLLLVCHNANPSIFFLSSGPRSGLVEVVIFDKMNSKSQINFAFPFFKIYPFFFVLLCTSSNWLISLSIAVTFNALLCYVK